MITAIPGVPYLISHFTLEEVKRLGKDAVKMFFLTGGFMVTNTPSHIYDHPEVIMKLNELGLKPFEIEVAKVTADVKIISVVDDINNRLPKWVNEAVLLHEVGHIVNGDLEKKHHAEKMHGNILIDIDAEIAADSYAASVVGKKQFVKALVVLFQTMSEMLATKFGKQPFDHNLYQRCITEYLLDPMIRQRFNALLE